MTNRKQTNRGGIASAPNDSTSRRRAGSGTRTRPSSGLQRDARKREAERRIARRRSARRLGYAAIAILLVVGAVVAAIALTGGRSNVGSGVAQTDQATRNVTGPKGPEGVPMETGAPLAPAVTPAHGQTVDGIGCDSSEQVMYHVHTHLSIYVDGRLRPVPAGVGMVGPVGQATPNGVFYLATGCCCWLHVHAQDGVIHIESPTTQHYTLGQFFDVWGQPLGANRVGPATGSLTVFVDGRRYGADPRSIVLGSHVDIQIDVGKPVVAPRKVDWSNTGL
jgi:hypothetical protein